MYQQASSAYGKQGKNDQHHGYGEIRGKQASLSLSGSSRNEKPGISQKLGKALHSTIDIFHDKGEAVDDDRPSCEVTLDEVDRQRVQSEDFEPGQTLLEAANGGGSLHL